MISVIIPNYNNRPYLGRCIGSVKRQSNRNWECIVIDDGSTDGSTEMCFDLTRGDSRFTVVAKSRNGGLPSARNTGMEWARGEYLFFLDSDDWIFQDTFDCLLGEASVHPDVARVTANYIEQWPGSVYGHTIEPAGMHGPDSPHLFSGPACDLGHSTGCLYIRENMPEDLEFPKVKIFEDLVFNMGLIFSGTSTFVSRKYVYNYIRHDGSLLSKTLTRKDADAIRAALKAMADKYTPEEETYLRFERFLDNAINGRLEK